jgi:hypothetical protein
LAAAVRAGQATPHTVTDCTRCAASSKTCAAGLCVGRTGTRTRPVFARGARAQRRGPRRRGDQREHGLPPRRRTRGHARHPAAAEAHGGGDRRLRAIASLPAVAA